MAWGIDVKENYAVLAQVDNPFAQPYLLDWGCIRILQWERIVTSVDEELRTESAELLVYPNPVNDILVVKNSTENLTYKILDNSGQLILSDKLNTQIDVSQLVQGFYHLVFSDGSVSRFVKN